MLVLGRKEGQTIVIDGNIRVTILKIKGRVARLGIEAPDDVSILRAELDHRGDRASQGPEVRAQDIQKPRYYEEVRSLI